MDQQAVFILLLGLLILGCIASSKLSSRVNMPGLLLFLLIGMGMRLLTGSGHLGGAAEALEWGSANTIAVFALSFILFSGGYDSSWSDIRRVLVPGSILASAGVLLCALLLGLFCYLLTFRAFLPEQRRQLLLCCLLFASLISSTDASAVFSILRSKKVSLKGSLKPLLEFESGSNDPMATFLTLFLLGLCLDGGAGGLWRGLLLFLPALAWKMAAGAAVGLLVGKLAVWLFNRLNLDYDGLYYVLGTSVVLLAYALSALLFANGFMAVYVAGVYMGSQKFVFRNGLGRFSNALAWLMQVLLFTLLGYMANPELLWRHRRLALWAAFFLMLVARPVATFICTICTKYSLRARTLISWVGLRGGAPIVLATFPMLHADRLVIWQADGTPVNVAELMFSVVFCMVIISVAIQSFTIMPLARLLDLNSPLAIVPTAPLSFDYVPQARRGAIADHKAGTADRLAADDYENNQLAEFTIGTDSDLDGKVIRELRLPHGVFVLMIRRGAKYLVPRGNTVIRAGDCLSVLATPTHLAEASVFFRSTNRSE